MKSLRSPFFNLLLRGCVLAVVVLSTLSACDQSKKSRTRERPLSSKLSTGYRLIDKGYSDQAINYFEDLKAEYPKEDAVKIALSSAYVSRSGLHIADFVPFVDSFQKIKYDKNENVKPLVSAALLILRQRQKPSEEDPSLEPTVTKFMEGLATLQETLTRIAAFPAVGKEKSGDLLLALENLDQVAATQKGAQLYAGILRLVLVKTKLTYREFVPVLKLQENKNCELDLVAYEQFLREVFQTSILACENFEKAYPSKAKRLQEVRVIMSGIVDPSDVDPDGLKKSPWIPAVFEFLVTNSSDTWKCEK